MITSEEIIEGNKLLAEFMGFKEVQELHKLVFKINDFYSYNFLSNGNVEYLYFHTSWDWLMPVIDKIENLGFKTTIQYRDSDCGKYHQMLIIKDNTIVAETLTEIEWIDNAEKYTKLEAVWKACLEFVEWFNTTKHN